MTDRRASLKLQAITPLVSIGEHQHPVRNLNTKPASKPRQSTTRSILALVAIFMLSAPFFFSAAFAQTEPPPPGQPWNSDPNANALSSGAQGTDATARSFPDEPPTNYVNQAAEQNKDTVIQNVEAMLTDNFRQYNDTYVGLHTFWGDDIISQLFANIGQLIGKWLTEFINGWVSDAVQFLTGFLRLFVLNPNIAVNGMANTPGGGASDDISPFVRQGADVMYGIAVDLLLLLFILCIWKYWAEAAWRGGGNLVGAVGRLIFTSGLMLAWPTIYAFEIQITNEMIKAMYFNSADQVSALDAAMAAAVKGGLMAGAGLIANATAPMAGQAFGGVLGAGPGGIALGTVGNLVAFAGLIIYLILGGILIAELIYILVLKAIQTALLTAQYMFAPIFIVFFATPDTENVTSGFVKSFVEVSLWTFVWVGLLKIFVIMILSDFNPWGKIILAVGILQMMIQVPSFLARAQISPMSDFVSAGLISGGLMKGGKFLSDTLSQRGMQLAKYIGGDTTTGAARGPEMSKKADLNGLAHGPRDPHLLKGIRDAAHGEPKGPKGDKDGGAGGGGAPGSKDVTGPKGGKPDGTGPTPPVKGTGPDGGKKKGEGLPGTDAAGKTINPADGTTPGTPPGSPVGDAAKKGLAGAGVAAGVGTAAAVLGAAGTGNVGAPNTQDARNNQAALDQAAMAAKKLDNDINSGVADGDKDGKNPKAPTLVEGKEVKTGPDGKKDDAKNGADVGAALANGLTPPAAKNATGGTGAAGGEKDQTLAVDRTIKPGPGGAKSGLTPPTADGKDLAALSKDPTNKDGAGAAGPDGKALNMDVEDGSAATGPGGVKLAPGATTGDKDGKPAITPPGNLAPGVTTGDNKADGVSVVVPTRRPGAGSKVGTTSPDPTMNGLGRVTSDPTAGRADPTTDPRLGDDGATDTNLDPTKLPPVKTDGAGGKVDNKTEVVQSGAAGPEGGATAPVTVKLPGRRVGAPTGNRGAVGDVPVDSTSAADAPVNLPSGTVAAAGSEGWKPDAVDGHVVPGSTPPASGGAPAKVDVIPMATAASAALGAAAAAAIPVPTMRRGGHPGAGRPTAAHGFIDPGWEPEDAPVRPVSGGGAGGGGIGGGGGGGLGGGRDDDPPDRIPHGTAPASPHEQRLQAAQGVVPMNNYQQAGYRWIPPRGISGAIRLAQDVTLGPSTSGEPELIGNAKGQTFHVRHAEGMDPDRLALQMMTAGYSTMVGNDPAAYDAARQSAIDSGADKPKGFAQRMAAGILSYNGGSWAQTANAKQAFQQALYTSAVEGSQAYVNGQGGNAYTEYLNQRYGPMTDEQQAWGVHIMTDGGSPESSWHWGHIPATETLVRNAIPINATSRAIATNPTVLRSRPWEQRSAISGASAYMESRRNEEMPDAHPMIADAWVGREAQLMAPSLVNTVTALAAEYGDESCRNVAMVNDVANIVGAGANAEEYCRTYQALRVSAAIGDKYKGGGGGGGPISGGTISGGGPGGGGGGGGFTSTSVSGTVLPGGGGAAAPVDAAYDVDVDSGPVNPGALNLGGINAPNMGGGGAPTRANVSFRHAPGTGNTPPPTQSMRIQGDSHPGAVGPMHINNVGGVGAPPPIINEQNVEVEIVPGHVPTPPPIDAQLIKVPPAASSRPAEVRANVTFIPGSNGGGGSSNGGTQRVRFEAPLRDSTPQVNMQMGGYNDPGNSGQVIETHVEAELSFGKTGDIGGVSEQEIESNISNMVNGYDTTAEMAYNVVYDLHSAGFSYEQLSDPKIAKVAMAVMSTNKGMAHTAAITAGKLGSAGFSMKRTEVVQAMLDCDPRWNENNIDPKSIFAAEAISDAHQEYKTELIAEYQDEISNYPADQGGPSEHPVMKLQAYPTKNFTSQIISHPDYRPSQGGGGGGLHKQVVRVIREKMDQRLAGKDPYYGGAGDYRDEDTQNFASGGGRGGRGGNGKDDYDVY